MHIRVDDEGHTLCCLLRTKLFECGSEFAATNVSHPQDTFMNIVVDNKQIVSDAVYFIKEDITEMQKNIKNYIVHNELEL